MLNIPLSKPSLYQNEINAAVDVLTYGPLSIGPKIQEFEKQFAEYVGSKHAVAVNSGTSALHLIMLALGIGSLDKIITTSFSFIATANCIKYVGAKPIFCDIDKRSFNISANKVEDAIKKHAPTCILPVHVFGRSCNMNDLLFLAGKYGVYLIEDACEALGTVYQEQKIGSFGDAAAFGFYPNKIITSAGEGGMITTDNVYTYRKCVSLRNQGRIGDLHYILGYNFRMPEINAAVGLEQLKRIDEIVKKRQHILSRYNHNLKKTVYITPFIPPEQIGLFCYTISVPDEWDVVKRNDLIRYLRSNGIESKAYFHPIHRQPLYWDYRNEYLPNTDFVADRIIALPFFTDMSFEQVDYVCDVLKEYLK